MKELAERQRVSDCERVIDLSERALQVLDPEENAQIGLAAKCLEQVIGERASKVECSIYNSQQAVFPKNLREG